LLNRSGIRMTPRHGADEPEDAAPAGTKIARLLDELARVRSATTASLCACAELDSRQVWGLLKTPRNRGQVSFYDGRWSLNHDWHGNHIERAAALLRSRGWTVTPPRSLCPARSAGRP
jgi:hypothetical protein